MSFDAIQLRGVKVHNLKNIDLDIPRRQLVVFCGVSGSGKTSLALDTLYAEGQRRYIESFSAYTRQFLERMDKPDAEQIDGIPPSIAVVARPPSKSSRATIGTATETTAYLRLLFAKLGQTYCFQCGRRLQVHSAESAAVLLSNLDDSVRFVIGFPPVIDEHQSLEFLRQSLLEEGFVRIIVDNQTMSLQETFGERPANGAFESSMVVVDRLHGAASVERIHDSLETAFKFGGGQCVLTILPKDSNSMEAGFEEATTTELDGNRALQLRISTELRCAACDLELPALDPSLFNFNSAYGACQRCEGFGNLVDLDMDLIIPDKNKSLEDGAIAPWNTPSYRHELDELLALSDEYGIPVHIPFRELTPKHLDVIQHGVPEQDFGGLDGFFAWLEKRKYKMHLRVFLSRWKSATTCPDCGGNRLRAESLAVKLGEKSFAEIDQMKIEDALAFFEQLTLSNYQRSLSRTILEQVQARLSYLARVGLGYLTSNRTLHTLSGGEAQRVALTSALGSSLVNMLYVLDEPSVGLHPKDTNRLLTAIQSLRDRGNSVVIVEHEESFLRNADHIVEIGPAAGENGGEVVFQGSASEMLNDAESLTGEYLSGTRGIFTPDRRRPTNRGCLQVQGARGHNLKNIDVKFPLGVMCLVTGVSGAGKSSLVQETLYPALCRRKRKDGTTAALPIDDVLGDGQIDDVIMVDQSPIGKSPRSNPVTYIKAFDAIRKVFAETLEARTHNYSASYFSFNVDGGRCSACDGDGYIQIDMQFLADVFMKCGQCQGSRYRQEILDVMYRGKNIAEVLQMSVRQAFKFFRGQEKVQLKLKQLMDVGLDYLRLGQPANTLSAGEAQRLKLAGYLSSAKRKRTLFLLDEPTTGLHFSDIIKLLDCFQALLEIGHSLIVVEHNLQMMKAADYIIDIGPNAAEQGGQVVVQGTPEQVATCSQSHTGRFLSAALG